MVKVDRVRAKQAYASDRAVPVATAISKPTAREPLTTTPCQILLALGQEKSGAAEAQRSSQPAM